MQILSVSNLEKKFNNETLFSNVSFGFNDHDRVALIGRNGTGKSTILKIILGEEEASNNSKNPAVISIPKDKKVGYLSQNVISDINNTLYEELIMVFASFIEKEKEIRELSDEVAKNPTNEKLINSLGKKTEEFENTGGYSFRYKIDSVINKFGFNKEQYNRKIASFSGGERAKIAFAKLLLQQPDLLILDEPTNHLDVSTIDWLENYLKNYNGAILFVSHDRYFINSLANIILNLEFGTIKVYKGNFDSYIAQKEMDYESQMKAYNIQQKEIEHMKRFIEYFKPKPRFVARAKDREKKLEHMVKIDKPNESKKSISFDFNGNTRNDKKIIDFKEVSLGYQENVLLKRFSFTLFGGDKLAIIGDNGTGKTTFLKTILKLIPLEGGEIKELCKLKFGYIAQNDFDIKGSQSILDYFNFLFPDKGNRVLRNHLGRFDFQGDDVFKSLDVLSGGEKMRVVLAKLMLDNYDVLLFDEPTNNLDMETRESLVSAMQEFNSCIIFVSHDRYFIDLVANKILYFQNRSATLFKGSYTEFKDEVENNDISSKQTNKEDNKDNSYKNKHQGTVSQKVLSRMKEIEDRIDFIKNEQTLPEVYMDYFKCSEYNKEISSLEDEYLQLLYLKDEQENQK